MFWAGNLQFLGTLLPRSPKSDESATNPEVKSRVGIAPVIACLSIAQRVDVGSACVDMRPSPKIDVVVSVLSDDIGCMGRTSPKLPILCRIIGWDIKP